MNPTQDIMEKVLSYKNFVHAVAGATGSVVGLTAFYLLDTVRTRLQVDEKRRPQSTWVVLKQILQEEGIESMYRGWLPVVSSLCCSNFVYFYIYRTLKLVAHAEGKDANATKDLVLGFIAGVVNVLVTTPLWVVNTRLKLQGVKLHGVSDDDSKLPRYRGIYDCLVKIRKHEGVKALWAGTLPSLVLVSNPALQFMTYELLKRYLQRYYQTSELNGVWYFIIGAVAKTIATVSTYPMQVVQTKQRIAKQQNNHKGNGITDTLLAIFRVHGFVGLFKGLEAKLLQTVLMAALMFLTYEKIVQFVFHMMGIKS